MEQLQRDRQQLANRAQLPGWFHLAIGLVAAGYVIAPALPGGANRSTGFIFALVATIILFQKAQRTTGIKVSDAGWAGYLVDGSIFLAVIVPFCITLGLVSFDLNWWAALPGLAAFVSVFLLSRLREQLVLERLIHGR